MTAMNFQASSLLIQSIGSKLLWKASLALNIYTSMIDICAYPPDI